MEKKAIKKEIKERKNYNKWQHNFRQFESFKIILTKKKQNKNKNKNTEFPDLSLLGFVITEKKKTTKL